MQSSDPKPGPVKRFFSGTSKFLSGVRTLFLNLSTLFVLVVFIVLISTLISQTEQLGIPESGALRVAINGDLVDQKTYAEPLSLLLNSEQKQETLVYELVEAIDQASKDDRINSMVLVVDRMGSSGISKIEEVGAAIMRFREQGKIVLAVGDNYTQQQYLLASYADKILLNPMGIVELFGYASYNTYMADALDKLKVNVNLFRTGEHKNALEPLIANSMSDASREQTTWLLEDIWASYQDSLLSRRNIDPADLKAYSHELDQLMLGSGKSIADIALEIGLVDQLVTRPELMAELQKTAGANEAGNFYQHTNAIAYLRINQLQQIKTDQPAVGLVVASGQIMDGQQQSGTVGGDTLAYQLRSARLDGDLKALIMRVDSPGGSAFASEVVRTELLKYAEDNIPIVISMGTVAASGGYWIAAPADQIWATPTTITGSIGAFSFLPTLEESLDAIGLHSDGVGTTPLAGALAIDRPLSEAMRTIFQSQIDNLYQDFLALVAEGREIDQETLEGIAGGRVWTGKQALENGLVDHLGGLEDAIHAAAELAGLQEDGYQVRLLEPPLSLAEQIVRQLSDVISIQLNATLSSWIADNWLSSAGHHLAPITKLNSLSSDPNHMYVHCELCPTHPL